MTAVDMNQTLDQAVPSESNYLTKGDIPADGVVLTIASFQMAEVDPDKPEMLVMHFAETAYKPMVIKPTNKNRLQAAIPDAQGLSGYLKKRVRIYVDANVEFAGKLVGGIRIDANAPAQPAADEPDDDLPF
jgi:hypothetical protein